MSTDDDPWDLVRSSPPPPKRSGPRGNPPATEPRQDTSYSTEEPASQRSYRRRASAATVAAIVIGGMSVLYLVSLAIAIPLGLFSEPSSRSSPADPAVMKQGQVVITPGTKIVLDTEGTSFAPSDDHASLVGTESGLLFEDGTSHVAVAQQAPERYDTCSTLDYPEPTGKPIAWNRLTIGSMLCVRTTYLATTTSLITVVERSGRSATFAPTWATERHYPVAVSHRFWRTVS